MALDLRQEFAPLELSRREPYILQRVANQRVLDLGFIDWPITEDRIKSGSLLHFEIRKRARQVVGIDQDDSVRHLFPPDSENYRLLFGNVEEKATFVPIVESGIELDLVLAGEIVEHLNNPGLFFDAVRTVMGPQTTLLITVPNGLRAINQKYTEQGVEWVHPDHNYWYSPSTIQTLCNKNGLHVDNLRGYQFGSETPQMLGPSGLGCPGLICEATIARARETPRRFGMRGTAKKQAAPARRPTVLCITDTRGWAYDFIVQALRSTLGHRFNLNDIPYNEFAKLGAARVRDAARGADAIYCFSAVMPDTAYDLLAVRPMVAGIHGEHQLVDHADKLTRERLSRFVALGCVNPAIAAKVEARRLHDRVLVVQNGVDTQRFSPPPARNGAIRCGWAGWAGHSRGKIKRFGEAVVPGCHRAGVPLLAAIREANFVAPADMPAYYRLVDVFLVASIAEGTSGPLLEAGASGCAMISTRVGAAEQMIQDGVNGFLVDGTIESIADRLYWCRTHPGETRALGQAARQAIVKNWDWKIMAEQYAALFDAALQESAQRAA